MAAAAMPELGESLDPWTEDDPENFDLDGFAAEFYGDASERRMRHLRDQLSSLRDLAESEQRQNVFAHYESFIRVSREISMLQGQVGTLREMVKVPAEVVSTLLADAAGSNQNDAEGAHDADDEASATLRRADERAPTRPRAVTSGGVDGTLGTLGGNRGTRRDDHVGEDGVSLGDAKRAAKLADDLDEALSGREVFAALETIEEGTKLLDEMRARAAALGRQTRRGGDETTSKAGTAVSGRDATRVKRSIDADTAVPTRTGSPSLGETRANPLFAAMQRTTTPITTPSMGIATSGTFDEKEGPATNDESEPGPIQQLALALADARAAALAALMDTLVDPHETKARRAAARDSLRRAGASASAARHVANAELAAARAATERTAKNERGVAFAVEACEAIFSALRVVCSERDDSHSPHGSVEGGGDDSSSDNDVFIAERVREETSRLWDLVADRCLGRWSTATSLPEACASVLVCVCHVDAFVADVGGTSVKQQHATCAVDVLRTHHGVNAGMKRVLDAATEAFVSDESDDLGGSSGNWIDAGERWLETTAWDDLRTLCERGIAD
jgi:hypothetical protein